jgi:hypothetical protein
MRSLGRVLLRYRLRPSGVIALLLLVAGGCAAGHGDVSGKVTYKGKALVLGTVQLQAADKTLLQANIGSDGSYSIPGVPLGEARVAVSSTNPQSADSQPLVRGERGERQPTTPKAPPPVAGWFPIPAEYGDLNKSRLTYTVKKGPNTYDIDLK